MRTIRSFIVAMLIAFSIPSFAQNLESDADALIKVLSGRPWGVSDSIAIRLYFHQIESYTDTTRDHLVTTNSIFSRTGIGYLTIRVHSLNNDNTWNTSTRQVEVPSRTVMLSELTFCILFFFVAMLFIFVILVPGKSTLATMTPPQNVNWQSVFSTSLFYFLVSIGFIFLVRSHLHQNAIHELIITFVVLYVLYILLLFAWIIPYSKRIYQKINAHM